MKEKGKRASPGWHLTRVPPTNYSYLIHISVAVAHPREPSDIADFTDDGESQRDTDTGNGAKQGN